MIIELLLAILGLIIVFFSGTTVGHAIGQRNATTLFKKRIYQLSGTITTLEVARNRHLRLVSDVLVLLRKEEKA